MPRNASGVYELPTGINPVIPDTTIATTWANPTLLDIAAALTNSLDRTGLGGMLAPFKIADGTLATPGLAFALEPSLGIYRPAAGVMGFVSNGVAQFHVTPNGLISLTRLEHHGIDVYKVLGSISWKASNEAGVWTLVPSATINGEDWDTANAIRLTGSGNLQIPGDVDVAGALTALSLAIPNLTVSVLLTVAAITASTVNANSVTAKQHTQTPAVVAGVTGTYAADYNVAQSHVITLAGSTVITPSNIPVGNIVRVAIIASAANVPTFSGVIWPLNVTPNLITGPARKSIVVIENDGASLLATSVAY